jgi:YesN/AraC family two-component response regulator
MPTALIADDERLMREQLRSRLREVWPELDIVAEAKNGQEAVALTEQHHPDIVFLDIRMPVLTGVDAARQIAQLPTYDEADGWPGCEVVFITAYDQYAVEAFEQGVVDYVLKPAERERLQVTVARIQKRLADRADHAGDDSRRTRVTAANPHTRHAATAATPVEPDQSECTGQIESGYRPRCAKAFR